MATTNRVKRPAPHLTAQGAAAARISPLDQLKRLVNACMLWEDSFYMNGVEIATAIREAVNGIEDSNAVAQVAIEAREVLNLRHAPLLVVREMARHPRHKALVAETLERVIRRADEITEFLSIYWNVKVTPGPKVYVRGKGYVDGEATVAWQRQPLSAQVKKGLAAAYRKFDEYALARNLKADAFIKLRDVAFLTHFKPTDGVKGFNKAHRQVLKKDLAEGEHAQAGTDGSALLYNLLYGGLKTPDTWEVRLSQAGQEGQDKAAVWAEALAEGRLTGLGLLKNLRNLRQAGVDKAQVREWLLKTAVRVDFPWRFIAAARFNPGWEDIIEEVLLAGLDEKPKLAGHTIILEDVSGSMYDGPGALLSAKSDLRRGDAAAGLAMILREVAESVEVWTFSNDIKQIPNRRGFALRDAITDSQPHRNTYLGRAVDFITHRPYDRLIVITDEQSADRVEAPPQDRINYMINVGANRNGVGYGKGWTLHIDGFSEGLLRYLYDLEEVK